MRDIRDVLVSRARRLLGDRDRARIRVPGGLSIRAGGTSRTSADHVGEHFALERAAVAGPCLFNPAV